MCLLTNVAGSHIYKQILLLVVTIIDISNNKK